MTGIESKDPSAVRGNATPDGEGVLWKFAKSGIVGKGVGKTGKAEG